MIYKLTLQVLILLLPASLYLIKLNATQKDDMALKDIHTSTPVELIFHNEGGHFGGIPFLKSAMENASSIKALEHVTCTSLVTHQRLI
eukprot:UN17401